MSSQKKNPGMMKHTIFTIPGITHFFRGFSFVVLKITGWEFTGLELAKDLKKCVIIAAPHTSWWDFPLSMMLIFSARMPIYWTGKKEIFRFPFKTIMRWMGGIIVDRGNASSLVESSAEEIRNAESLYMIVTVEGTRKKVDRWKSGFYRIAQAAEVPILLGYLDFEKKRGGFIRQYQPSGDYDKDIVEIREHYKDIKGFHR